MREIQRILSAVDASNTFNQALQSSQNPCALVTLVRVQGSSYRRPGARMFIEFDGTWVGAISGGCLEGDVLLRAKDVMRSGVPTVQRYDTRLDTDNVFGLNLGCEGVIDLLIEPIASANHRSIQMLRLIAPLQHDAIQLVVFESSHTDIVVGQKWLIKASDERSALQELEKSAPRIARHVQSELAMSIKNRRSYSSSFLIDDCSCSLLVEFIAPATRLYIFGAGQDALSLCGIAKQLDWFTAVFDKSPLKANASTFHMADIVHSLFATELRPHLEFNPPDACVLMSHNIDYDCAVLEAIVGFNIPYIGILGPRHRAQRVIESLAQRGVLPSDFQMSSLHAPTGLDLGSETPEEIALSIAAEIQSCLRSATSISLRDKAGTIHS